MMNIPVGDENFANAMFFLGVTRGDGDVVEEAEAHAAGGTSVVAWRADCAEGVFDGAGDYSVDRGKDAAGGEQGCGVRFFADGGVTRAELAGTGCDVAFGRGDVLGSVAELEIFFGGGTGLDFMEIEIGGFDGVKDSVDAAG